MYLTFDEGTPREKATFTRHEGVPDYDTMSEQVQGLIQPVDLFMDEDGTVTMYVNEEFLLRDFSPTLVVENGMYRNNQPLVVHGPVIIVRTDNRGETSSLKESDLDRLKFGHQFAINWNAGRMVPCLEVE